MDLRRSPQVAVMLAVTPDHLNWHRDMAEYEQAKSSIARHQTPDDLVVYAVDNPPAARIAATGPERVSCLLDRNFLRQEARPPSGLRTTG